MGTTIDHNELCAYADVVLRCGVNLEPGQKLLLRGSVDHSDLIAALAERAYAHGAAVAYAVYRDDRVARAQAVGAPTDELAAAPAPWMKRIFDVTVDERWALIVTAGDAEDDPFAGAPAARVSALQTAVSDQSGRHSDAQRVWNVCSCPSAGWAQRVYGEPDEARLWADLRFVLRLDEPDPVAAWQARRDELTAQAARLNEARFSALRFRGAGTDLYVPLHADAVFMPAEFATPEGHRFLVNLPTEELFTSPDFRGVEGTAVATRPTSVDGTLVEGLVVRFEEGRIVDAQASSNRAAVTAQLEQDAQARFLGEVALVDGSSRVGQLGRVFRDILLDENATCHIAWGDAYAEPFPDGLPDESEARLARGVNASRVHQDMMLGGPEVSVLGVTAGGDEVPVLVDDRWQI
jgi:aminopeptidase